MRFAIWFPPVPRWKLTACANRSYLPLESLPDPARWRNGRTKQQLIDKLLTRIQGVIQARNQNTS